MKIHKLLILVPVFLTGCANISPLGNFIGGAMAGVVLEQNIRPSSQVIYYQPMPYYYRPAPIVTRYYYIER